MMDLQYSNEVLLVVTLAVMALGLGGVLAALFARARGLAVSAMSIAMPVLLFGAFALLEQQAIDPAVHVGGGQLAGEALV